MVGTRVVPPLGGLRASRKCSRMLPLMLQQGMSRILHTDGSEEVFDLYKAMREGVLEEDPLLRSGDVITP